MATVSQPCNRKLHIGPDWTLLAQKRKLVVNSDGQGPLMAMQQLIYASRPFGYDAQGLANILATARILNARNDITGALICRSDVFLQLLEGPVAMVESTFGKISEDDRHVDVRVLVRAPIEDRLFPDWTMKHDPARSWLWSRDEIHDGVMDRASARDIRAVFLKLATD